MGGRKLPRERVQEVLGFLAAGLNPAQAARAAGVSQTVAYDLDRSERGVSRLADRSAGAQLARSALRGQGAIHSCAALPGMWCLCGGGRLPVHRGIPRVTVRGR